MELVGLTQNEINDICMLINEKSFRAKQLCDWLYRKNAISFDDMTNIPKSFQDKICKHVSFNRPKIIKTDISADGTTKYLLQLTDGETIETVLLLYENRTSICVSTQVGCGVGCAFCATGAGGFVRNLTFGEIAEQVLIVQAASGRRVSHVVFMGMGEGLLNFDNLIKSIHLLNREVGIAMRHITVSTVGIIPAMNRLADMNLQLTLALSLHAPYDALRQKLIPVAKTYSIDEIIEASANYSKKTGRKMTVEYILLDGVNDSDECAMHLARLVKKIFATVNIIPYNSVEGKGFKCPPGERIKRFKSCLKSCGIECTQRLERGGRISGACGQLRQKI